MATSAPPCPAQASTMEEARREAFRVHQKRLRTEVIVTRLLHDCRQLLTDVEYSLVSDKSKDDNESAMDELINVLLRKEDNDFDRFCSALRTNGYSDWAMKLEAKAREGEVGSISPADPQLLTDVETAWVKEEPPKTNSPTNGPPNRAAKCEKSAQTKESAAISPNDRRLPVNMEWTDSTLVTGPQMRDQGDGIFPIILFHWCVSMDCVCNAQSTQRLTYIIKKQIYKTISLCIR